MTVPKIGRSLYPEPGRDLVELAGERAELLLSPKAAGEALLAYLPADAQKLVREAAGLQGREIWHVLLGYALRAYERFDMFMYSHLDSWERQVKPTEPWPCSTCQALMWSRFPEAQYCCNACYFGKLSEKGHGENCLVSAQPL